MTASRQHTVRPRWVWGGTALTVAGLVLIAVELMSESRTWAIVGGVVVLLGLVLAWAGGVTHDVNASRPIHEELDEVVHGGSHEGPSAIERVQDARAGTIAETDDQQRQRRVASVRAAPAPLAPAGVVVLFVASLWLVLSEWVLGYSLTTATKSGRLREDGVVVVVVLAALWLRLAGRSRVASALCLISGVGLLLAGLLITSADATIRGNEAVSGAVIGLAAIATMIGGRTSGPAEAHREEAHG